AVLRRVRAQLVDAHLAGRPPAVEGMIKEPAALQAGAKRCLDLFRAHGSHLLACHGLGLVWGATIAGRRACGAQPPLNSRTTACQKVGPAQYTPRQAAVRSPMSTLTRPCAAQ